MGDFPTHDCYVTYDGEKLETVSPMSWLDCDQPECVYWADVARARAAVLSVESIASALGTAEWELDCAMEQLAMCKLVVEAKGRLGS